MQVANALNNSIRILFNPRVEAFRLFDFLIVKSDDNRYLGQITEIYDDKFDSSQDVAKIRLFYKINKNNEVMPYDNFTPNRECEIVKINQDEIENFINQDKETFIFATNMKNQSALNVQYEFFENNCVALADKIENSISLSLNLAKNLSKKKNVVIIDFTGAIDYEGAKKIKACSDFKIPLNYSTIDVVYEKCLYDSSLEFQSIGGEIINEIKKFAKRQEGGFIPFNSFVKVLLDQYKATPYSELKLLLTRIKKHQMDVIFARTKKESEALQKNVEKNPITIIDLSSCDVSWQKPYLDYISSDINNNIYLIARINEESIDMDLLHKIYCLKKNIKFIPMVSYSYKKLPSLMQYCNNYILMPSLYQRMDFLDANFALSNLILEGCLIFGKNTDNFIYQACDYELELQERRKNYRKIELSVVENEEQKAAQNSQTNIDYYEEKQDTNSKITDSQRLMNELSDLEFEQNELHNEVLDNKKEENTKETKEEPIEKPSFEEAEIEPEIKEEIKSENDSKIASNTVQSPFEDSHDEFDNIEQQPNIIEDNKSHDEFQELQEDKKEPEKEIIQNETKEDTIIQEEPKAEVKEESSKEIHNDEELVEFDNLPTFKNEPETKHEEVLSDEQLDFYQAEQPKPEPETEINIKEEEKSELSLDDDKLDLSEVANNSIDNNFENIINKKPKTQDTTFDLGNDNKIDLENLSISQKENLPIFNEENDKQSDEYSVGNIIVHKKYGRGKVVKTIKYEQRQLLQIEFEESGKKLLDPKVADIKLEQ